MRRTLRLEYPGAVYHVMSRAKAQGLIFLSDVDQQDSLRTLAETRQKTGFQVHAYDLMRNHFHLVVETPNANLVAGMRWLASGRTGAVALDHERPGQAAGGRAVALGNHRHAPLDQPPVARGNLDKPQRQAPSLEERP